MDLVNVTDSTGYADKIEALREYLSGWHDVELPRVAFEPDHSDLPESLRLFYGFAASQRRTLFAQNRLLLPDQFEEIEARTVFFKENQGVWSWAFEKGADPSVWMWTPDFKQWKAVSDHLSSALVFASLMDCHLLGPCRASVEGVDSDLVSRVASHLQPLQLKHGPWLDGIRYFFKPNAIASVGPSYFNPEQFDVSIVGTNQTDMEFVWDISDDSWEIEI